MFHLVLLSHLECIFPSSILYPFIYSFNKNFFSIYNRAGSRTEHWGTEMNREIRCLPFWSTYMLVLGKQTQLNPGSEQIISGGDQYWEENWEVITGDKQADVKDGARNVI